MTTKTIAATRSASGMPTARLMIWWVVASEIVIFGGLLASYIMHRLGHPEWALAADHTNRWAGGINTFVLLTSSLFAVLAHQEAEHENGRGAAKYLLLATTGGAIFCCIKAFEWTNEIREGFTIVVGGFWSYYYVATGLHALHVIAGMAVMLLVAAGAVKNRNLHRVECIGIYWHFVDIVWIFLFPLLYIAR